MSQPIGQLEVLPSEDPHLHLKSNLEITDAFNIQGFPNDALWLVLFNFSLKDEAKTWLNSQQMQFHSYLGGLRNFF